MQESLIIGSKLNVTVCIKINMKTDSEHCKTASQKVFTMLMIKLHDKIMHLNNNT